MCPVVSKLTSFISHAIYTCQSPAQFGKADFHHSLNLTHKLNQVASSWEINRQCLTESDVIIPNTCLKSIIILLYKLNPAMCTTSITGEALQLIGNMSKNPC